MATFEFSVPYNGDPRLIDILSDLNKCDKGRIREVYLSGPLEYSSSGRVAFNGDFDSFSALVRRIHDKGLRINLIMNSTCEGAEWYSDGYLEYIHDFVSYMVESLGIESITLANPLIMKQVHAWVPQVELCASVLGDVDCAERAKVFANAGATVVTPEVSVNRDFKTLRRIRDESGMRLKVMVNEGCLHKCALRKFHFNAISHIQRDSARVGKNVSVQEFKSLCNQVAGNIFFGSCSAQIDADPSLLLKSGWIRPEDLEEYRELTTYFKISGRTIATRAVERTVSAYLDRSYSGDLLDIMDSSLRVYSMAKGASLDNQALGDVKFFSHVKDCDKNCPACGYCNTLVQKVLSFNKATSNKIADRDYFA